MTSRTVFEFDDGTVGPGDWDSRLGKVVPARVVLLDVERLALALEAAADGLTEQGVLEPNAAVLAAVTAAEYDRLAPCDEVAPHGG